MTYRNFLQQATRQLQQQYDARESANMVRLLLEDLLGVTKVQLPLLQDTILTPQDAQMLQTALDRLLQHEPIQHITGLAAFYGHMFKVNNQVLIPRPETEELVHWILEKETHQTLKCLDIGTGSGCIPISLQLARPNWQLSGIDVSHTALQVARENASLLGAKVDLAACDILDRTQWAALAAGLNVVVSNPPYITQEEMSGLDGHVRNFEPHLALTAKGDDALVFYKQICTFAQEHLAAGSRVYFELNAQYAAETKAIAAAIGLIEIQIKNDMQQQPRMLRAVVA